jgi:hypothetical protein
MSTARTTSGHCLCGAVSYVVSGELRPIIYCHCEQCRRTSGHYVAATACKLSQLVITGEDNIKWYRASPTAQRGFCVHCGSNLFWQPEEGDYRSIWAGSLNRPTGLKAEKHIYVHMASDYYDINDGLPQHDEDYQSYFSDAKNE